MAIHADANRRNSHWSSRHTADYLADKKKNLISTLRIIGSFLLICYLLACESREVFYLYVFKHMFCKEIYLQIICNVQRI